MQIYTILCFFLSLWMNEWMCLIKEKKRRICNSDFSIFLALIWCYLSFPNIICIENKLFAFESQLEPKGWSFSSFFSFIAPYVSSSEWLFLYQTSSTTSFQCKFTCWIAVEASHREKKVEYIVKLKLKPFHVTFKFSILHFDNSFYLFFPLLSIYELSE